MSRRKFMDGVAAGLVVLGAAQPEPAQGQTGSSTLSGKKLKVVVAGGHPGDPEYGCGGTIACYTQGGAAVSLLYLNRGQGGIPRKPPEKAKAIRSAEAAKACEVLKARPVFAAQIDGATIVDKAHYDTFRSIVESENPDVLFAQWPIDNHPDHRATSMLCYDAWLHLGKSFGLYYYEVSNGEDTLMFAPTEYVDVSSVESLKRTACYAHASQSPDRFYALETQVAAFRGMEGGFKLAEAFVRHVESPGGLLPNVRSRIHAAV